jgi:hypothetical protein
MSESELQAIMNECMAYDDTLRHGGHFTGGEALDDATKAITLGMRMVSFTRRMGLMQKPKSRSEVS